MFQERLKHEKPIAISEFLYPLLQGYDSVALRTDGEVGGNDQLFNMMVGRDLCKEIIGTDKMVVATHLVIDPVSGKKMSKTEGTLIAVSDAPAEIRRKVLALHDTGIETVFRLCTRKSLGDIAEISTRDPREQKELLARELVGMYHGEGVSQQDQTEQTIDVRGAISLVLKRIGAVTSLGEAKRLISQGGVIVNDNKVFSWDLEVNPGDVIRVGKGRVYRVK
jgi:tyrosyl-tRNA synthetase